MLNSLLLITMLHLLQRAFNTLIIRYVGKQGTYLFGAVGIPVHEIAHAIAALLCGHKIKGMSVFNPGEGYVIHSYSGSKLVSAIANLLISLAPIAGGITCIYYGSVMMHPEGLTLSSYIVSIGEISWQNSENFLAIIIEPAASGAVSPAFWLWLYLTTSIALYMLPSHTDLKIASAGAVIVLLLALLIPELPEFLSNVALVGLIEATLLVAIASLLAVMLIAILLIIAIQLFKLGVAMD